MKSRPLTLLALAFAACSFSPLSAALAAIAPGDTREDVIAILGKPTGYIGSESYQILYFDRGEVVLRDGLVQSHTIVSQEEADQQRAVRELERQAYQQRKEEARERRIAEGKEIRDQKLADPQFAALEPRARLAFWQVFRQKYPEVDVELEYTVALQQTRLAHAERLAEADRQHRLDDLERRVREAEHQAELAEREAQAARQRPRYYPVYHYPRHPVVHPSCPPTDRRSHSRGTTIVVRTNTNQTGGYPSLADRFDRPLPGITPPLRRVN